MVHSLLGHTPELQDAAFVAENATLLGQITLHEGSSVWYGAVLRAENGSICVGKDTNVQDLVCLHSNAGHDITIGEGCSIGHGAIVHGCRLGDHVLVGMHSTIMNDAVIGEGCIIAAGALVPERTVVPPHSLVIGVPGKVVRQVNDEQYRKILDNAAEYLRLSALHHATQPYGK